MDFADMQLVSRPYQTCISSVRRYERTQFKHVCTDNETQVGIGDSNLKDARQEKTHCKTLLAPQQEYKFAL